MQFIPGLDQIWVYQLTPESPIYEYDNEEEAINKANELQSLDSTGRQYKVHKF
jgi:hypothetical protein